MSPDDMRVAVETPLKRKIREAYKTTRQYHALMEICFPNPSSHRCASHGGPPACARPFGRAIREMGGDSRGMGSQRYVWLPPLRATGKWRDK